MEVVSYLPSLLDREMSARMDVCSSQSLAWSACLLATHVNGRVCGVQRALMPGVLRGQRGGSELPLLYFSPPRALQRPLRGIASALPQGPSCLLHQGKG